MESLDSRWKKIRKSGLKKIHKKLNFCMVTYLKIFGVRRCVMIFPNLSGSLAKPLVMAKLNLAYSARLENRAKLLLSLLPVSPSRVLLAPGTSPFLLVPDNLRATWPRFEQFHLFSEACSPKGTDDRQQRHRRATRPPHEFSKTFKRFHAPYDDKKRYYEKRCPNNNACMTLSVRMTAYGVTEF